MEQITAKLVAKGYAKTTADTYVRFVRGVLAKVKGVDVKDLVYKNTMMKDTEDILDKIIEYAPQTQISILNAFSRVLGVLPKTYSGLAKFYEKEMKNRVATKPAVEGKTEKQEANWVSWDDVVKKRDEVSGVDKVILSLYTMLPPGRVQEYATMGVNSGENMYDVKGKRFVISKHKTSAKTGVVVVDVPDELVAVLTQWLDGRETGLLLGGLTAPSITKHLNKIFGKKVGPSLLRHIYLSGKYETQNAEMKKDAKAMRHSIGTQQSVYVV